MDHCHYCWVFCPAFVPCRNCIKCVYCSIDCREADDLHKLECGCEQLETLSVEALLVLRLITKFGVHAIQQLKEKEPSFSSSSKDICESEILQNAFNHFGSGISLTENQQLANDAAICIIILFLEHKKLSTTDERDVLVNFISDLLVSLPANIHGIGEMNITKENIDNEEKAVGSIKSFGVGLYDKLSLANHSCLPNFVRLNRGKEVVCIASRRIRAGEEINENYGMSSVAGHTREFRQRELYQKYGFKCDCIVCEVVFFSFFG